MLVEVGKCGSQNLSLPDEGLSTAGAGTYQVSPMADGLNVYDNNPATNAASTTSYLATNGTNARHDPQTTAIGGSEYLLADGHVKCSCASQYVSNFGNTAPLPAPGQVNNDNLSAGCNGQPCAATFNPQ